VTVQLAVALKPRGIAVNAVCPGWVRTDMGGAEAPRSLQQGADSILWLVLKATPDLTGGFWRDGERIPW
jgi:NAD(P)-dependent dehydrogenase (short-subunit alcohol dehydrogenase family)